jgi:flagellar hook assembly protein FlgD
VAVNLTLADIYPTAWPLGSSTTGGEDRPASSPASANLGVIVWIEDNSGNYVKTVEYYLSSQANNTTYAGTYSAGTHQLTHASATFDNATTGIARHWTSLYSPNYVGVDGVSAATLKVPHAGLAHQATWDGTDHAGNGVAAGTYKVKILVLRHTITATLGSTEYSYTVALSSTANSTGTAETSFPLAQPGDVTNATTENGVATGISVAFTHS